MGWSIRELRPDVFGLVDPHGGIATHGDKAAMEEALQRMQPAPVPVLAPAAYKPPSQFFVGSDVYVVFWRDQLIDAVTDHGQWDVLGGTYISGDSVTICYELWAQSTPSRWGGNNDAIDGSALRFVARDRVFATMEEAKTACQSRPKPVLKRAWTPASR